MTTSSPWAGPRLLFSYLLVVLVTGALLAPLLWELGQWYLNMARSFRLQTTPVLGWLAGKVENADFPRFFNRAFLLAAVAWIIPYARWAGVTREDLGLVKNPRRWWDLVIGFVLAASILLLVGYIFFRAGRYVENPKAQLWSVVQTALIAAFAVGFLEEWFFRGALLGFLLRKLSPRAAIVFLSAFFSILHLLQPPEGLVMPLPLDWKSGFWMVGQIFARFGDASFLLAEFTTLFVVGYILGYARLRTRSLWLAIGLHAGWVFGVKFFSGLTRTLRRIQVEDFTPWIGKDIKSGLGPLAALALTGLLVWLYLRRRPA